MKWTLLVVLASLVLVGGAAAAQENSRPRVLAITFGPDLEINPVTQGYLTSKLSQAAKDGYDAAVILLDTPGGLSSSMKTIYQAELASKVPVIVYVSPEGSRAASAGVWVSQAADVLAMSPDSNIGSSTPIDSSGAEPRLRPAPQGDQRRGRLADRARSGPSPQHEVAGEGRARSVEPHGAAGARDERDRRGRPDAARAPEAARRLPHEVQAAALHAAPRERGDRHGQARLRHALPQHDHQPEPDQPPLPARDRGAHLRGAPSGQSSCPARSAPSPSCWRCTGSRCSTPSWGGLALMLLGVALLVIDLHAPTHGVLTIGGVISLLFGLALLFQNEPGAYRVNLWLIDRHRRGVSHLLGLRDREGARRATPAGDDRRADDDRADGRGARAGARLRRRRALAGACGRRLRARARRGGRGAGRRRAPADSAAIGSSRARFRQGADGSTSGPSSSASAGCSIRRAVPGSSGRSRSSTRS